MVSVPLSLYIHIPWCVQKCPYCDFNSHGQKQTSLPEKAYVAHLLDDLALDAQRIGERPVETIFIGGGTPSLFSEQAIERLLQGVRERVNLAPDAEITLEANPGTVEAHRFAGYVAAGVNRFSVGVQSFSPSHLKVLGRIHNDQEAENALALAQASGVNTFNLDLMHGLPEQSLEQAMNDLKRAIALNPPHLSWYQLTIEPNTPFYSRPPELPDDDILWDIQTHGHALLEKAGYRQYEISAYSKPNEMCQHNINYWRFGDYLGIGCGAHGKISNPLTGEILRTVKVKHPRGYMTLDRPYLDQLTPVTAEERPFEFFMNRFRLHEPILKDAFEQATFQPMDSATIHIMNNAVQKGLVEDTEHAWQVTPTGRRYLNSLLAEFV
ncbi:radical SAM family heme chaperone HemW [Alteromonas sediminis]|uniref:Heme chaperone HemW n=1 Tax=Alteromonas sediminis TaxID=2259342 RepID=A0A3N5YEM7_9ALTE|nr:radical SAM family heme chaperone HemW [Alteromonas sediminis]RPJ68255.1 radical SAM family heme chaperone HemW [Alteromonas sediminis]